MENNDIATAQQAELQLKKALSVVLDENAYTRLMNVRLSNAELYLKVANAVMHYYQKLKRRISEKELITIINMNLAVSKQPETKIYIRRK